ncbi:MAG: SagB/ThcOx family dehydrogenase [Candidatus Lokiarchaeota archaeon]|nr:SagB/ThcOx family dehydrogenase [Candidatus Lokiarchaeota archaeon]
MNNQLEKYGNNFQQKSKYIRNKLPQHRLDWTNKPKSFKTYSNAIKTIKLLDPEFDDQIKFWNVVFNRKSTRKFKQEPITQSHLSQLLYGMTGLTRISTQFAFRTVPSAGGLFPIEIYPIINNVEELDKGIYHYNIAKHMLELLRAGDFRVEIAKGCLDQQIAYNSAVNFVWTAVIERSSWKYLQRCYRYIYLDAGHIGQNFYLTAEALGLGACTIGAIYDDELNELLEIDGINETAIYVGVVGKKFK